MKDFFFPPWCFPSSTLLLVEHSNHMQGRAAILVSCPAETIRVRMTESKDKLLNVTQEIFITTGGLANQFVEKKDKSRFIVVLWCICGKSVPSFCEDYLLNSP